MRGKVISHHYSEEIVGIIIFLTKGTIDELKTIIPLFELNKMRKLLSLLLLLLILMNSLAQIYVGKKQFYKVEGYILEGTDTIRGIISIPIKFSDVDYNSLAMSVSFTDTMNHTKKYRPKTTAGFGLRGDVVLGDYVSIRLPDAEDYHLFLKRLLAGPIMLYEQNLDRTAMIQTPTGTGGHTVRKKSIDQSIYFLQKGKEVFIKIEFDPQTTLLKKNDLKKLVEILPDVFANSDKELNPSDLLNILSDYNSNHQKE